MFFVAERHRLWLLQAAQVRTLSMVPHALPAPLSLNSGPILLEEVAETARGNQQYQVKYASYLAVVKAQLIPSGELT